MILQKVSQLSQWVGNEGAEGVITSTEFVEYKDWDKESKKFIPTGEITQLRITIEDIEGHKRFFEPRDYGISQNYLMDKYGAETDNWVGEAIKIDHLENPKNGKFGNYIVGSV